MKTLVQAHAFVQLGELVGLHLWIFALLLLPGLAGASLWRGASPLPAERVLASMLCGSGAAALGLFYVYVLNRHAGYAGSWIILGASAARLGSWRRQINLRLEWKPLVRPALLCFSAGLLYSSILFLSGGIGAAPEVAMNRYLAGLPPDPVIPWKLAEDLYSGSNLHPFFADWLSSDRPPLQAAVFLLIRPLVPPDLGYQVMATIVQTWAFLSIWLFLRVSRVPNRSIAWVLSFAVFSGFMLLNSTYVWPKLLPAAYLLVAAAFLVAGRKNAGITIGLCAGLAMMGHGGSAFGVLALATYALIFGRKFRSVRSAGAAVTVCAVVLAPWALYQKFFDPPGDRLLKWHLAGVIPVDSRSFLAALRDSYGSLTFPQWIHNKAMNLQALFTDDGPNLFQVTKQAWSMAVRGRPAEAAREAASWARLEIFFHLFQSLGVVNLGIGALLLRFRRRPASGDPGDCGRTCLSLGSLGAAFWCLLMFIPGSTANHQGSYFVNLCLIIAGGLGILSLPRGIVWALSAVNAAMFFSLWAFAASPSGSFPGLLPAADPAMALLFGVMLLTTCFSLASIAQPTTLFSIPMVQTTARRHRRHPA